MKEKLKALMTQREGIVTQQRTMLDKAEAEKREFTADETTQYEAMDHDFERLDTDIATLESEIRKHTDRRAAVATRQKTLTQTVPGTIIPPGTPHPAAQDAQAQEMSEIRSRAFNRYLTYGERARYSDVELRALQADKDVIGGFLVAPEQFQLELIKAIDNSVYMRQICRTFTVAKAASLGVPTLENDPAVPQWTAENIRLAA